MISFVMALSCPDTADLDRLASSEDVLGIPNIYEPAPLFAYFPCPSFFRKFESVRADWP
jgi:hypothetical protein